MSRSILKQSSKIGAFALVSRCIAFLREILLIRFLSVGETSDIFYTAFRIPNTMRKIFAEGALASVLVPALINAQHKDGKQGLNRLTTLSFIIIESFVLALCIIVFFQAPWFIAKISPGFSADKVACSADLLKVLISFILFFSSSAVFASALQAQHKFFIPAIAPSISNILYVSAILMCLHWNLSITSFCYLMIASSVLFFLTHIAAYFYEGFHLQSANKTTWRQFKNVLIQFLPCFLSVGVLEINHFINTAFASYLPSGSLTLLRYAYQFINIPIGIITASLVTVLLPHFSKLHLESPKELASHLIEAVKFIIWTTLPICFLLGFFSKEIFQTLFIGDPTAIAKIETVQAIFLAFLVGLLFFSLNKILLSVLYALQLTSVPMLSTLMSISINIVLNQYLMEYYGAAGIAFASSVAAIAQTIFFITFLHIYLKLTWPVADCFDFLIKNTIQLATCCLIFWLMYQGCYKTIESTDFSWDLYFVTANPTFFLKSIGMWAWVCPLIGIFMGLLHLTRKLFRIKLTYFD